MGIEYIPYALLDLDISFLTYRCNNPDLARKIEMKESFYRKEF